MKTCWRGLLLLLLFTLTASPVRSQGKRKIIIDQDARGPASTDMQSILVLIQSPETEVLGITVVSGDQWRDEEVAHTLRLLEIIGRTDIPVVPGAIFPLVNRREDIERWEKIFGKVAYEGAWNPGYRPDPYAIPRLREGSPTTKPLDEDAPHFLIRMLHKYPHQITIYAGGPLTNLALAIAIDPEVPKLAQELVDMGPGINAGSSDPEWYMTPRRGYNTWWDPEASHIVFRAPWPKITVTTEDMGTKTHFTKAMMEELGKTQTPVAQYVSKYGYEAYMWDEIAAEAWLDPSIVTKEVVLYMDFSLDHNASYGDTLVWLPGKNPGLGEQPVHVLEDLDMPKFYRMFMGLMTRPTPGAHVRSQRESGAAVSSASARR
jgi:inosine-uridine nucleoside N-ribohydrolase